MTFDSFIKKFEIEKCLFVVACMTLGPALIINLGRHNMFVHTDEPRRALVSLEMLLSHDFITPTLNGERYFNKPPVYNWVIALFFNLFGEASELALRIPTVLFLAIFAATIGWFASRYNSKKMALLISLAFLTNVRLLFFDSFLGMIDICYSWVVFSTIALIFFLGEKRRFLSLFVGAYFLSALSFLMKGLPSVVFLATTLIVYFIFFNNWRRLLSWQHLLGMLTAAFMIAGYYLSSTLGS